MGDGKQNNLNSASQEGKSTARQLLGKKAREAMMSLRANDRVGSKRKLHRELSEALEAAHASGLGLSDMENRSLPNMWEELALRAPDLAEKWAVAGRVRWQDTGLGHALKKTRPAGNGQPWEGLADWLIGHAHLEQKESVAWIKMVEGAQFLSSAKSWMDWAPESEVCKEFCFRAARKMVESAMPLARMEIWRDERPQRLDSLCRLLLSEEKAQEAMAPLISEQVEMAGARARLGKWSPVMLKALEGGDAQVMAHVAEGMGQVDAAWTKRRMYNDAYRQMRTCFEVAIDWGEWACALWLMDQGGHVATLEAMDAQESFAKNTHALMAKGCRSSPGSSAEVVARRLIVERARWLESKGMAREEAAKRAESESGFAGGRLRASQSKSAFEQLSLSVALELRAWVAGEPAGAKKVERNSQRL